MNQIATEHSAPSFRLDPRSNLLVSEGTTTDQSMAAVEATVESFVQDYFSFGKAAARHTIEKFATLVEAQRRLGSQFVEFCSRVRLDPKSGTFRKKLLIGKRADELLAIADQLPPSWTTIYRIAELSTTDLDRLASEGTLHPEMTAKDLTVALGANGGAPDGQDSDDQKDLDSGRILTIDVTSLAPERRSELCRALQPILITFGVNAAGSSPELFAEETADRDVV
ncbi:hypothetical protein J4G48_0004875 [Bradyrhizobium barranii subsp. apii]|uniref:hypothetical protein n=1 Tax=Bradyrhizobium barranii TaxID=2992140 RepID=UPI001AA0DDB7|nr:hypothetical protein [Bradyrhizobium barranii]UPT97473.1 hypothetical protein J4G48_0004875 [Bradyrhizobium barranii subsp. apii]